MNLTRRKLFWRAAQVGAVTGPLFQAASAQSNTQGPINRSSSPSRLKITDIRACRVAANYDYPIIRVYTNEDVYGLGEVRDAGVEGIALILKSHLVNRNPLDIEGNLRRIRPFANHGRMGGGFSAIDMALHDIAGKVYNAPVYAMVGGGKFRDKIRIYADTTESKDPKIYAQRLKERKEGMGLTWLKMDLGAEMVSDTPGTLTGPSELSPWEQNQLEHPFIANEVTDKGIAMLEQFVAAVRDAVGMEIPLSMDHLGHLGVKSIIRLGKAYEKYNLSWMEDVIPWTYTDLLKQISDQSPTPILTGEDIYLKEPFKVLCQNHAVSKIQPDLATSGGILETHKIGDIAEEYGVPMAMHFAGTPISCMANVHCAAATQNFLALENHSLDVP